MKQKFAIFLNIISLMLLGLTFLGCEIAIEYFKKLAITKGLLTSDITIYTLRTLEIMSALFFIIEVIELFTGIKIKKLIKQMAERLNSRN